MSNSEQNRSAVSTRVDGESQYFTQLLQLDTTAGVIGRASEIYLKQTIAKLINSGISIPEKYHTSNDIINTMYLKLLHEGIDDALQDVVRARMEKL